MHQWRDLDPERFTDHADRINHDVAEVYGLDGQAALETYDNITVQEAAAMIEDVAAAEPQTDVSASPAGSERLVGVDGAGTAVVGEYNTAEARESRRETLASSEVPPAAREARMTADYLHAQAPRPRRGAPAMAGPGTKTAVKRARIVDRGRG